MLKEGMYLATKNGQRNSNAVIVHITPEKCFYVLTDLAKQYEPMQSYIEMEELDYPFPSVEERIDEQIELLNDAKERLRNLGGDDRVIETPPNEEPSLMNEDSPRGVLCRIGDRLHNIGCGHQDSELGDELEGFACELWTLASKVPNRWIK